MKKSTKRRMAITVIAHGSRIPAANRFLTLLVKSVSARKRVNLAFLEMASPTIATALKDHLQAGCTLIRVLPLFLAPGRHAQSDVKNIIADFSKSHPQVKIDIEPILGNQSEFGKLLKIWILKN
jgi:sirohydrochlorin cobaltochelatase